uniref:Uncharacterized protein n=1 Tax=Rhizophora mucronata TaxID=61149 RepID=A0A2P2KBU8_RHIMU
MILKSIHFPEGHNIIPQRQGMWLEADGSLIRHQTVAIYLFFNKKKKNSNHISLLRTRKHRSKLDWNKELIRNPQKQKTKLITGCPCRKS